MCLRILGQYHTQLRKCLFCSMFLIVYRSCDKKGSVRYLVSFKMSVLIAATVAGLISENAKAVEPYKANTNSSIERLHLGKSGPGPRAKADAMRNSNIGSGSLKIRGADGFVSSRNYKPYQKPLSAKRPGKIRKSPLNPNQEQGKNTCKSEVQETKTYNIQSQIDNHKKSTKIYNRLRKNPKLVLEFNSLEQKLKTANMKAGRGVKPLSNSNGIYYARGYSEGARLYFKYSGDNIIIILGESDKPTQDAVIQFLLKNY